MLYSQKEKKLMRQIEEHVINQDIYILSYGMGVESTAILLRWIKEPETCPVPLDKLIVITSQVGNEWNDTGRDVDEYILPLLRNKSIRFVQVARHGHSSETGITILEDSHNPSRCFLEGDYKLSTELLDSGIVPQFGGEHRCSLKFKAFVIEHWLEENVRIPGKRLLQKETGYQEHIAFGFNIDEQSRVNKAAKYDTPTRHSFFPLLDWGWSLQDCIDYIQDQLQVHWKKSACVFCPFAHNKQNLPDLLARQVEYPKQVADAMVIEHMSLSLNPRGVLYSNGALIDLVFASKNESALTNFEENLNRFDWTHYHVRRIYSAKGKAQRAVEKLPLSERRQIAEKRLYQEYNGTIETKRSIAYNVIEKRNEQIYPTREEFFVAAPALAQTKTRYGMDYFNRQWVVLDTIEEYEQCSLFPS